MRPPKPLAAYVRRSGAVGKPRVTSLGADIHGRIRSGPDAAWMPFTGEQVNTYGARPTRAFIIDATRSGLPVTVLHLYDHTSATMRGKLLSLATVVDAAGPEMDRGETVTVFNDLVVLAPGAIVDAPVRWTPVDANHVRGVYTTGDQSVSATSPSTRSTTWSTSCPRTGPSLHRRRVLHQAGVVHAPVRVPRDRRPAVSATGEARWSAPAPEGASPTSSSTSTTSTTTCPTPRARQSPRAHPNLCVHFAGLMSHDVAPNNGRS